jgi:hypothetical protein
LTLAELSEAWNGLRNAALGRGTTPAVSAPLAAEIGDQYDAWRKWVGNAGPMSDVLTSATGSEWVDRYRTLDAKARAEGVSGFDSLPTSPFEALGTAARAAVKTVVVVAIAVSIPIGLALLWGRKR